MADIKIVINDVKTGKSYQKTVEGERLLGKKIGEKVKGKTIGLSDFELEITGGSDSSGFPMRKDLDSLGKKRVLLTKGVGLKKVKGKGYRKRKTVRGNTISSQTAQVNMKIVKYGSKKEEDLFGKKEEKKEEVKEKPKKEKRPEKSKEEKSEKKKE